MGRTGRADGWRHDQKNLGWRRFSGPRKGDWLPGRPWSHPTPRGAAWVERRWATVARELLARLAGAGGADGTGLAAGKGLGLPSG